MCMTGWALWGQPLSAHWRSFVPSGQLIFPAGAGKISFKDGGARTRAQRPNHTGQRPQKEMLMMEATKGYLVAEDQVVHTLEEVANLLGVEEVTEADIAEGGNYADIVSMIDLSDTGDANAGQPATPQEDLNGMSDEEFEATGQRLEIDEEAKEDLADMSFDTVDDIKVFIKDLDTPTLEAWARALEVEWEPNTHANINRMRIAMAVKGHYFPELAPAKKSEKKRKAKYGDFSTEQLFEMAADHKVKFKRTGNEPIDRMNVIMALRTSKVLEE